MKIKYLLLTLTVFSVSLHGAAACKRDEQLKQFHSLNERCKFAYTVYTQNLHRFQAGQVSNECVLTSSKVYNKCVEDITNLASQSDEEVKKLISVQGFVKVKVQQAPTVEDFSFRVMQLLTRKRAYKSFLKEAAKAKVKESIQTVINDCDIKLVLLLQEAQKLSQKLYLKLKDDIEKSNNVTK